ncbi:MAG: MaoC family dehydratase N-terminal domain-containing protein, partial [Alphaproteobacteria bacterium]|nr:MaoC family dehydratase N-terminal domain-containing protein [Alphaproteobacteria bacterium]
MANDMDLQDWIGQSQVMQDRLDAQPAQFMQATLDHDLSLKEGDPLPPLWHWLYFLEAKRASDLGRDAHPKKGGFLPPVSLPRRMWAGGRFTFHAPLILGRAATKRSTIKSITEKVGRSGALCFVTVAHEILQDDQCAITEEQDIVYRDDPAPDAPTLQPDAAPDDP